MAESKPTVLVLWGNYFDECAATVFVCELRAAGVRVRVVGVDGRLARGRYGVMLGTDTSLERVLIDKQRISHVVLPCSEPQWQALQDDPQTVKLLQRLAASGAVFIAPGESDAVEATIAASLSSGAPGAAPPLPLAALRLWPPEVEAAEVVRKLIKELFL